MDRNRNRFMGTCISDNSVNSDAKITAEKIRETEIWKLISEERFGERLSLSENKAWYQF